jgi:lipopolysaccharide export system protein LptA
VVVTGNVTVKQGQTVMHGNQLNVDLDKNTSQLTGGRVKGSFVPQ